MIKNKSIIPKVAIIILNYESYNDTLKLIDNLYELLDYPNLDIIIVDNASENDSVEILTDNKEKYNYHLIINPINSGYAAGNNLGIRFSYQLGAKYIWVLNNDIILTDKYILKKLVDFMELNNRIGAVSPKIIFPSGNEEVPNYWRPSMWDLTFGCYCHKNRRYRYEATENMKIYRPKGSCMLLRSEYIKQVGEMDENTFLYFEESILAERMLKLNYECWLYIDATVIHHHSKTIDSVLKKMDKVRIMNDSCRIYIEEYRGVKNIFLKWIAMFVNTIISYAAL